MHAPCRAIIRAVCTRSARLTDAPLGHDEGAIASAAQVSVRLGVRGTVNTRARARGRGDCLRRADIARQATEVFGVRAWFTRCAALLQGWKQVSLQADNSA